MKNGDKVWYGNWRGTIVTIFKHPQSHVRVAVVDLGSRPGLEINRPGFYWDGNMIPIAICFLSKEPKSRPKMACAYTDYRVSDCPEMVYCPHCKHAEKLGAYAIAQRAMHHAVDFVCPSCKMTSPLP